MLDVFDRGIALAGENCERVEIPYGEAHLSALYVRAEGVEGRGADPGAAQRAQFDEGDEIPRRPAAVARAARRVVARRRPARNRRGAAPSRYERCLQYRDLGEQDRRLAGDARTTSIPSVSAAKAFRSAATTARARSPSSRASPAASSGAPITTGATCRRSAWQREGNLPGAALLGARALGLGRAATWTTSCASPRTFTSMACSTASRSRSSSLMARRIRKSRSIGRSAPMSSSSTARSAS